MKVFVYGTLKRGFGNHVLLAGRAKLVEDQDAILGKMVSLGGFPGWLGPGEGFTYGETYEVPEEHRASVLRDLDRLEGYRDGDPASSFYIRTQVETSRGHTAFAYKYNGRIYDDERESFIEVW